MKVTKTPSPMRLIISIVDDGMGDEIEKYLDKENLKTGLMFKGKGTAESDIADIFGFGMSDKDIIAIFVPSAKVNKVIEDLNNLTGIESHSYGLNMVININSASSNLLDSMGIKLGGDHGKESK